LRGVPSALVTVKLRFQGPEPDMLGQAYEYLINRFAHLSNRKASKFHIPPRCGQLLVSILDPEPKESSDQ
jgi:type I restriction-modification system DNA methylase subunit